VGSATSTRTEIRRDILARGCRALHSGGFNFLVTGETTLNQSEEFERSPWKVPAAPSRSNEG
jgi:hypothetical protein